MTAAAKSVLESALALSEVERVVIAEALLESVPSDDAELDDEALYAELNERREDSRSDPSGSIPWSEAKKMR